MGLRAGIIALFLVLALFGCAGYGQQPSGSVQQAGSGANGACAGMSGNALVDCTYLRAVSEKDVTACTALAAQEQRYSCIARWCGSEARDYSQCDRLPDSDDRLGCLNKCNPNPNI